MMAEEPLAPPREVRDLAARLGAAGGISGTAVMLRQRGTMRDRPSGREVRFRAVESIGLQSPEFEWRASIGPFGCISVTDAFRDGKGELEVRALGFLPLWGVRGGAVAAKGEVMRYLAELAWAPDAILCNPSLRWTVCDERRLRVSVGRGEARGEVELRLDENGRVGDIQAENRPRKESAGFVERPWRGRFFDYRQHQGRWLPFAAEAGWVLNGQSFVAWRGEMLDWACV